MSIRQRWTAIPTWKKAALGGGLGVLLLAILLGGRRVMLLTQGGPWGGNLLGTSRSTTIGSSGCFLTAMTIAANALTGSTWNPGEANEIVVAGQGFSGASLIAPAAARALNVIANASERIFANTAPLTTLRDKINKTLGQGGLPIVHVDDGDGGQGDHFLVVHKRAGSTYVAADPATGRDTLLNVDSLAGKATGRSVTYRIVGVVPVKRAA